MDRAEVLALVERGLDGGRLLRDEGSESLALPQAMAALIGLDEVAMAARATAGVLDDAQRRGSVTGFVAGSLYRLATEAHRGDVKSAETDLRTAVELSVAHGLTFALPGIVCLGTDVLLERPGLGDIASLLSSIELEPALAATASGAWLRAMRGRADRSAVRTRRPHRTFVPRGGSSNVWDSGTRSWPCGDHPSRWRSPPRRLRRHAR